MPFDHGPRRTPVEWADGHGRYALCPVCQRNPATWRFPEEYKQWRAEFESQLRTAASAVDGHLRQGHLLQFDLPYDRMPGRFSRMALGMILSAMDRPEVARSFPQLGRTIGAGLRNAPPPDGGDITPWRLLLAVCDENWGFTTGPVVAPNDSAVVAFVDPPFVFYLHLGDQPLDDDAAVDVTRWLTLGHSDRLDGARRRERTFEVPFRFNAYDYGEFHYMLRLGALHAVSIGRIMSPAAEAGLWPLAELGLIVKRAGRWQLTPAGSDELNRAPVLEARWQRPRKAEPPGMVVRFRARGAEMQ